MDGRVGGAPFQKVDAAQRAKREIDDQGIKIDKKTIRIGKKDERFVRGSNSRPRPQSGTDFSPRLVKDAP
jgi:hypothetical protein